MSLLFTRCLSVWIRINEAGGEDHFSSFFWGHVAFEDFFIIHEDDEASHGVGGSWDEDGGGGFTRLGVGEISGDEADEAAAGAGVFDVGDAFKLLRSAEVTDGIDALLNGGVDEADERDADDGVIDPAGDFFTGPIGDGDADNEEEGEGDEKPEEVIAREAIERPGVLVTCFGTAQGVEGV